LYSSLQVQHHFGVHVLYVHILLVFKSTSTTSLLCTCTVCPHSPCTQVYKYNITSVYMYCMSTLYSSLQVQHHFGVHVLYVHILLVFKSTSTTSLRCTCTVCPHSPCTQVYKYNITSVYMYCMSTFSLYSSLQVQHHFGVHVLYVHILIVLKSTSTTSLLCTCTVCPHSHCTQVYKYNITVCPHSPCIQVYKYNITSVYMYCMSTFSLYSSLQVQHHFCVHVLKHHNCVNCNNNEMKTKIL